MYKNIPKTVRSKIWTTYINEKDAVGMCYVGCGKQIRLDYFECGHVISQKFGGNATIENLRPICGECNKSMGTQNMKEFVVKYGLKSQLLNEVDKAICVNDIQHNTTKPISGTLIHITKNNLNLMFDNMSNTIKFLNQNYNQVLYYYNCLFDKFVGDLVINVYKKENIQEQQIWSFHAKEGHSLFIINISLDNNKTIWIPDLNCQLTLKQIIFPFLDEIRCMMEKYLKKCLSEISGIKINDETDFVYAEKIYCNFHNCIKLIRDINDKVIHDDILRYIIPKFQLQIMN